MRNALYLIAFIFILSISSCRTNKKIQVSKAQVGELRKDSIKTISTNNEKNSTVKNDKKIPVKKLSPFVYNTSVYVPLPPAAIVTIFKKNYPTAREASWIKKSPSILGNKNSSDYKVNFLLDTTRNSIIYSENGDVIEVKKQILLNQLPPKIYSAIKYRYPDFAILSASTIQSTKIKGSYSAVIFKGTEDDAKEVILLSNGTFVE